MSELIMVLSRADKPALGALRSLPGLQAADDGELVWLRGIAIAEEIDLRIRQLPALHTYELKDGELLFPPNALTPVSKLQTFNWQPLSQFITVTLPVSGMPGKITQQHRVRLIPCDTADKSDALLTSLETFKTWVATAPKMRLQVLRFAVSENNRVLIIGSPLPPIPGREYIIRDGILLPCGYQFDPPAIAALLNTDPDEWLLFEPDGHWQPVPKDCFVPVTRNGVRLSEGRAHAG